MTSYAKAFARLRSWRSPTTRFLTFDFAFTIAICALLWAGIAVFLTQQRSFLLLDAAHDTSSFARAFQENTTRTIEAIDRTLLFLRSSYAADPDGFDLPHWQRDGQVLDDITLQLSIIDRDGNLRASNLGPVQSGVNLGDRQHFQVQAASAGDALYISKPVLGRESGKWSIQFTRKVLAADKSFAGVAVVSLDPLRLAKFYASLDLGTGSVLLVGLDGAIRAGAPVNTEILGQDISGSPLLVEARKEPNGTLEATRVGGSTQIMSFRRLDRYGLVVAVGLNRNDVLASNNRNRLECLVGGGLLTAAILLVGGAVARRRRILARAQATLAQSQELLTDTLESMSQGIFMVDADRRFAVVNRRAIELLGLPPGLVGVGKRFDDLVDWQVRNDGLDARQAVLTPPMANGLQVTESAYERTRVNGTIIEVRTRWRHDNRAVRTFSDITARKQAEAEIVYLAHHDGLTGLANRRFFHERLAYAIAMRHGGGARFAVLCLDLDRFKQVNDSRGHQIGDRLLRMVADRLRASVREADTVARFGGDEFAILQTEIEQPTAAATLGERLIACLSEPYAIDGAELTIGVSVGIACHPGDGLTADPLLKSADIALYKAKEDGRGRLCFFEPEMGSRVQDRYALERDLREAVALGRLEVHFQPICDVGSGRLVAFEALARWMCPGRGLVSPEAFIPIAEETGLIGALGRVVLRLACQEAARWPAHVGLSVNLSPLQFAEPDLEEQVLGILRETGLAPARLALEITERTLISNGEQALAFMHAMQRQGIRMHLDDFGAGHAGLSYLMRFPFDCIKIDRSFVKRVATDRAAEAVIRATVVLSDFLQLDIVAEGVETSAQCALLRGLRCHHVQGFLIDKPRPGREITEDRFWTGYREWMEAASPLAGG